MNVKGLPFIEAQYGAYYVIGSDRVLHRGDAAGDAEGALALS